MHAIRPSYDAITRAVRWTVLVLAVVLAMLVVLLAVVTAPARADPGQTPDQTGPDQEQAELLLQQAITNGTATGTYVGPFGNERWVGVFGTHAAAGYGYPYAAAPDCNEGSLGAGCVGDSRGFLQGQCTSWVAYRLAMRNGLSFSNWYAGRHWGNASEWGKVAKGIGHKPDKYPAVGAIGWYKRGHVSYVEDVYSGGTILISEMNTDGHNGFHFTTVSPGMSGYPDKFIHLDDVVPVDTTPPTEPTDVRVAAHRGRSVVSWRASSDTWGVAGYRVLRNGVPIGNVRGTSYRDGNPLAGQTATYSVVAYDAAGHTSSPGRVKVLPGTESVDRAWLETSAGPALCGRVGTDRRQRLGCRVLVDGSWRAVELSRRTAWGDASTRAFLAGTDGSVSYCRQVGRSALSCTAFDAGTRAWGADRTSGSTPRLVADATWVSTPSGPARCGLTGSERHPTATCSVLTLTGWHSVTTPEASWGNEDGRAFVATQQGAIAFCRWLPGDGGARTACTDLNPFTLTWSPDRVSGRLPAGAPAYPTWVGSSAGPAACWSPSADRRGACRVLGTTGWRTVALPRKAKPRHGRDPGLPDRPLRTRDLVPAGRPYRGLRPALAVRVPLGDRAVDAHGSFAAGRQPHLGLAGRRPRAVRPGRHRPSAASRLPGAHQRGLAHRRLARRVVGQRGLPRLRAVRVRGRLLPHRAGAQERLRPLVHLDEQARVGRHAHLAARPAGAARPRLRTQEPLRHQDLRFRAGFGGARVVRRAVGARPRDVPAGAPATDRPRRRRRAAS